MAMVPMEAKMALLVLGEFSGVRYIRLGEASGILRP